MYKKILTYFVILAFAICLSGCAKYSTDIELTPKDEVIISQQYGIDKKIIKAYNENLDTDVILKEFEYAKNNKEIDTLKEKGYSISSINNEKYLGKKLFKKFNRAVFVEGQDLPEGIAVPASITNPFKIKKRVFGTSYSINLKIDSKKILERKDYYLKKLEKELYKESNKINRENNIQTESQNQTIQDIIQTIYKDEKSEPEFELTIKIPKKAKKHNATSFDRKTNTYKWVLDAKNIEKGQAIDVNIEYSKTNFISIIFLILVISLTVKVVYKNKEYAKQDDDETKEAF